MERAAQRNGEAQEAPAVIRSAPENRRHGDSISVDEARLLPRYRQPGTNTPAHTDHRDSRDTSTATSVNHGTTATASPAELRGIPCIARSVGGAIPHTNPLTEAIYRIGDWKPR